MLSLSLVTTSFVTLAVTIITVINVPIIFDTGKESSIPNTLIKNANYNTIVIKYIILFKIFIYFYIN